MVYRVCFGICVRCCRKLLTIVLFAVNRSLRKKRLHLVINTAFADLMLGTVSLPLYTHYLGYRFGLWKGDRPMSIDIFYAIVDTFFLQASLISAAFISGEVLRYLLAF